MTKVKPFNRCKYCERRVQECFGFQFFVIAFVIIVLLTLTLLIHDLPALVLDNIILTTCLVALLAYLASKETNEIVLNNVLLGQLNRDLEEKVKQRTKELERSNVELTKTNQMKNEFIGIINHELKSPITTVISGIDVIRAHGTEKLDESQNKLLNIMEENGQEMLRLTNDLLDLSKIESGKIIVHSEPVPLLNMIEETVQSLMSEIEKKKIKVATKIDDAITTIFADSVRLKQVIFNLIENAVKFTGEKGRVNIEAKDAGDQIKIDIKDSGIGIKKEDIGSIFDKFAKRPAGFRGTGLGLYIAKSLTEAHNGKIEVSSEEGKGSTFSVFLPKKPVS
jgi:signal transduction histidine kinase